MAAAGDTTLPVMMMGGDDTTHCGGGFLSKAFGKGKNAVLNFISGLKSGGNREVAPPSEDSSGSDDEKCPEKPIIAVMEKLELGKVVFMLAVPLTTGVMFTKTDTLSPAVACFTLVANAVGSTAIWNGILLRKTWPRVASVVEQAGMISVFLGLHMLVGSYLSPELRFFPVICWGFSVLPFVAAAIPAGGGGGKDQHGVKQEDVCPV